MVEQQWTQLNGTEVFPVRSFTSFHSVNTLGNTQSAGSLNQTIAAAFSVMAYKIHYAAI